MRRAPRTPMLESPKVARNAHPAIQRPREAEHEGAIEHGAGRAVDLKRRPAIESIGATYRLTPSEVRVLHAVVEVGGIREIAAALAISPTTVKTHLRHIFQKTGIKGQVELIRQVARAATCSGR